MTNEAVEYLMYAVEQGWLWCQNCHGRHCMACVFREVHDACRDDCYACCRPGNGVPPPLMSVLDYGWDGAPNE